MEFDAGQGGEEGGLESGPEEAGFEERCRDEETGFPTRHSEARLQDRKPAETGLEEQWDEVQPKRARALPGQQQLEGFPAGRLAHKARVGEEHSVVACQTEQWRGLRATEDFHCQEQLERQEIQKRFGDKEVSASMAKIEVSRLSRGLGCATPDVHIEADNESPN